MGDDLRRMLKGAAVGAVLGCVGGLLYSRLLGAPQSASGGAGRASRGLDKGKLLRLGWSIVGVIRQITSLD